MITQELIDYIAAQIKAGVDATTLRRILRDNGWTEEDLNHAFDVIKKRQPARSQPAAVTQTTAAQQTTKPAETNNQPDAMQKNDTAKLSAGIANKQVMQDMMGQKAQADANKPVITKNQAVKQDFASAQSAVQNLGSLHHNQPAAKDAELTMPGLATLSGQPAAQSSTITQSSSATNSKPAITPAEALSTASKMSAQANSTSSIAGGPSDAAYDIDQASKVQIKPAAALAQNQAKPVNQPVDGVGQVALASTVANTAKPVNQAKPAVTAGQTSGSQLASSLQIGSLANGKPLDMMAKTKPIQPAGMASGATAAATGASVTAAAAAQTTAGTVLNAAEIMKQEPVQSSQAQVTASAITTTPTAQTAVIGVNQQYVGQDKNMATPAQIAAQMKVAQSNQLATPNTSVQSDLADMTSVTNPASVLNKSATLDMSAQSSQPQAAIVQSDSAAAADVATFADAAAAQNPVDQIKSAAATMKPGSLGSLGSLQQKQASIQTGKAFTPASNPTRATFTPASASTNPMAAFGSTQANNAQMQQSASVSKKHPEIVLWGVIATVVAAALYGFSLTLFAASATTVMYGVIALVAILFASGLGALVGKLLNTASQSFGRLLLVTGLSGLFGAAAVSATGAIGVPIELANVFSIAVPLLVTVLWMFLFVIVYKSRWYKGLLMFAVEAAIVALVLTMGMSAVNNIKPEPVNCDPAGCDVLSEVSNGVVPPLNQATIDNTTQDPTATPPPVTAPAVDPITESRYVFDLDAEIAKSDGLRRNGIRNAHLTSILEGVFRLVIENQGQLPLSISAEPSFICGSADCPDNSINLSILVDKGYAQLVPSDPLCSQQDCTASGYTIKMQDNVVTVSAPLSEFDQLQSLSRAIGNGQ